MKLQGIKLYVLEFYIPSEQGIICFYNSLVTNVVWCKNFYSLFHTLAFFIPYEYGNT